jgi:hypothetical protein
VEEFVYRAVPECLSGRLFCGRRVSRIGVGVELHEEWLPGTRSVVVDEPRMRDRERQGSHGVITSRDLVKAAIQPEEDLVGDGLRVVDAVGAQVTKDSG